MSAIRIDKRNEEAKRVISEILSGMTDPRIASLVSVVGAEVANDLSVATIRVSVYEDKTSTEDYKAVCKATVDVLNNANRYIAHELGQRMLLRHLPHLKFVIDNGIRYSAEIAQLLEQIKSNDASLKKEPDEQPAE